MPQAIWFIIGTQFTFFALFGCVQTVQYFQLLYLDMDMYRYFQSLGLNFAEPLHYDQSKNEIITQAEKEMLTEEEHRKHMDKQDRDIIKPIANQQAEATLAAYYLRLRRQSWQNVALAYSVLSVIAKTSLEFGFIWLVYYGSFADVPVRPG